MSITGNLYGFNTNIIITVPHLQFESLNNEIELRVEK